MLDLAPVVPLDAAAHLDRQFDDICREASELEVAVADIFIECTECCSIRAMSSIPHGIHAASKVHLNMEEGEDFWGRRSATFMERKMNSRGSERATSWPTFPKMSQQFMDHPLAKYNSKLMNSIWGLYNRYSVHNFKRVTEEEVKGRAGEWTTPTPFAFNKALQPNLPTSATVGVGAAPALPTAPVPIRDPSPLNTLWIGGHAH